MRISSKYSPLNAEIKKLFNQYGVPVIILSFLAGLIMALSIFMRNDESIFVSFLQMITIISFIAGAIATDAYGDSIKDLRVHKALHPFGDFWHLLQMLEWFNIFSLGQMNLLLILYPRPFIHQITIVFISIAALIVGKIYLWNDCYTMHKEELLHLDAEWQLKIKLPYAILKFFGFHN